MFSFMLEKSQFVVNYDDRNWHILIHQLETDRDALPPHSRLRLLQDAFLLTKKDLLSPAICLSLLSYIRVEEEPMIWKQALEMFQYFDEKVGWTPFGYRLHEMMRALIDARLKASVGRRELTRYEREVACLGRHQTCYQKTRWLEQIAQFLKKEAKKRALSN